MAGFYYRAVNAEVEILFSEIEWGQTALVTLPFASLASARDFAEKFNTWTDYSAPDYMVARVWAGDERVTH